MDGIKALNRRLDVVEHTLKANAVLIERLNRPLGMTVAASNWLATIKAVLAADNYRQLQALAWAVAMERGALVLDKEHCEIAVARMAQGEVGDEDG